MIYYKTNEEVEMIRKSCLLTCSTIAELAKEIKPGISPKTLDALAYTFIKDNGATPAFLGYGSKGHEFPATCCISVNSAVVHGVPNERPLQEGDIISIDTGTILNGFIGDSAYTFAVGEIDAKTQKLLRITKESLYKGIEKAVVGNRIGDIGYAVQAHTDFAHKFGVVRELSGHGLGRDLHEEPEVPNFGRRGNGIKLQDALVIAIEPMINLGTKDVVHDQKDGWTILTKDGKPSAHYEHTICVRRNKADILSSFDLIEQQEASNSNLTSYFYKVAE
jgi:methionyl aminopeptidase